MKTFKYLAMLAAALALAGCGGAGGGGDAANGTQSTSGGVTTQLALTTNAAGNTITAVGVNVGTLAAAPAGQVEAWNTAAGKVLGVTLLAQLDSSGQDAWDPARHPLVYVATQGPGYFGTSAALLNDDDNAVHLPVQTAPGLAIIDANTYEAVASGQYKASGLTSYSEPHGVGVSPDGRWIYIQGNHPSSDLIGNAALFIINARTLKVDKIIRSRVHHVRSIFSAKLNKNLMLVDAWGTFYALDPADNNKVVASVNPANLNGAGYLAFGDPTGKYLFISTRTGFTGSNGGVAVVSLDDWLVKTRINTDDASPIWVAFTSDGKTAYVSDGEDSKVAKIDMSNASAGNWSVVGLANAGTAGPYGISLNWKENRLFTIGKGEASHNMGNTAGFIDTSKFADPAQFTGWNTVLGEVFTGCLRGDHAILHPDPAKNELWISCNSSFNNVVLDMGDGTLGGVKVKKVIDEPQGGSSHGGAMVAYKADWSGELLSDTNGFHGSAVQTKKDVLAGTIPVGTPTSTTTTTNAGATTTTAGATTTTAGATTTTTTTVATTTTTTLAGGGLDGQALFSKNCGFCHTPAERAGRTADQIKAAINGGVPAMGFLTFLSDAQIQAISAYLNSDAVLHPH